MITSPIIAERLAANRLTKSRQRNDRYHRVLQHMPINHVARPQSLGVQRTDKILPQHLQHRGTGHARDDRRVLHAQRDRRQHKVGNAARAARRQPAQSDRECHYQQQAEPKFGTLMPMSANVMAP
jgi:hypothetical protein